MRPERARGRSGEKRGWRGRAGEGGRPGGQATPSQARRGQARGGGARPLRPCLPHPAARDGRTGHEPRYAAHSAAVPRPPLLPLLVSGALQRQPWLAYSTKEERPIGRYPVPNKKDMPYDIMELMDEVEMKTGFLPNMFKAMSHRPAEFRAFFAYYDAIMNKDAGQLSEADKELIIVATSAVNRCPYCVIAHGALHRIYSKQPMLADQVTVNWKLADLSDRELAMLEFALAVCQADNITEEHFQKLERHGFDREDAWDIGMISAFFAVSNHIAHFIEPAPKQGILYYGQGATWGEGEGGS